MKVYDDDEALEFLDDLIDNEYEKIQHRFDEFDEEEHESNALMVDSLEDDLEGYRQIVQFKVEYEAKRDEEVMVQQNGMLQIFNEKDVKQDDLGQEDDKRHMEVG